MIMNALKRLGAGALATAAALSLATGVSHAETGQAATDRTVCGLYIKGNQDYYSNCDDRSELIWVSVPLGLDYFTCVPGNSEVQLGHYLRIWSAFHHSWNC
jgi:hypothetical protein